MERVGIDIRVQGRQAAEQDLQRIGQELRGLGTDTRDAGGDADRLATDFDAAMRDLIEASRLARAGVGNDLGRMGEDLRGLGGEAEAGADGIRSAFSDLDFSNLGGEIAGMFGGAGAWGVAGAAAAGLFAAAYMDQLGQEMANDITGSAAGAFAAGDRTAFDQTVDDLYMGAYGDDYGEVSAAVGATANATAGLGLGFDELAAPAEAALILAEATGASVEEIIFGVANLARTTGTDIMDVFDLVAASGDRINGVFREDLFDVLGEYPAQLQALGLSSEDLLAVLGEASTSGVTNLDVVADSLKEFGVVIRGGGQPVIDALESLSLNADDIIGGFAAGGPEAREALGDVLDALLAVDEVTRYEAAATLGAGPLENLGLGREGIEILSAFEDGLTNTESAMKRLGDAQNDNDGVEALSNWRDLKENFSEVAAVVGQTLVPELNAVFDVLSDESDSTTFVGRWALEIGREAMVLGEIAGDYVDDIQEEWTALGDFFGGWWGDYMADLREEWETFVGFLRDPFGGDAPKATAGGVIPKAPAVDLNPWGTGGGGAATFQPSTHAPAPVIVNFNVTAMDEWGVSEWIRQHGREIAEEVVVQRGRAAVTE